MYGCFAAGITGGLDVVTLRNQIPLQGAVHPSPAEILCLALTSGTFLGGEAVLKPLLIPYFTVTSPDGLRRGKSSKSQRAEHRSSLDP